MIANADDDEKLVNSRCVKDLCGDVCDMTIWRWGCNKALRFPKPAAVINQRKYWRLGEIRRWIAARNAAT